ncbi:adenylyl-sulfate kinase [Undibacterium sp. Ji67W]|uniref:adenylyl-sulfate kinase n=1 Tax=Undibacterium sp. Ji67W TaxID=3413042 RepID=UPI003BF291A0
MKKKGHVFWLTGLSGAGKSTLAKGAASRLDLQNLTVVILDGDDLRSGLCSDLGFDDDSRHEQCRRMAHIAKLLQKQGVIVLVALISPFKSDREKAQHLIGEDNFSEIFVDADLLTCISRDTKGLYKKSRFGENPFMTGISSIYEHPSTPDLVIQSTNWSVDVAVEMLVKFILVELE